ncbi:MAG: M48 family metalloprotease [Deltaproteobacteria bacterium]|nr:M48 family metalloprotease [Deltaproteobacteria bacterium]
MLQFTRAGLSRSSKALILILLLLSGCASLKDSYVEKFGSSVLRTVGLGPATSVFSASEGMVKAAQEMSREEEYYLGRAVAAQILSKYKRNEDPALNEYLNKLGLALAAFSEQPNTFGGYHFVLLESSELNAMAAPGGFIFITSGMLKAMPDEDALASILAHEIVHVEKRHGIKSIKEENLTAALLALGELGSSLACGPVMQQATAVFGAAVQDVVDTLLVKGYSRELEYEADAGALVILDRTGYNPFSLKQALDVLDASFVNNHTGWFDTHPGNDERRERAIAFAGENNILPDPVGVELRKRRFVKQIKSGQ